MSMSDNHPILSTIRNCARCQSTHENLIFARMQGEPIEGKTETYTHWAQCPNTGEPIVLAIVDTPYDSTKDTCVHIERVCELINEVTHLLSQRAVFHDQSKLGPIEKSVFDEFTPKLRGATYGSDEYKGFLKEMKVALDHHYTVNRHHPEFFCDGDINGVRAMNLVDLLEMICDWKAASEIHETGDILKSIEINKNRFDIPDVLVSILLNTVQDFDWADSAVHSRQKLEEPREEDLDTLLKEDK